MDQPEDDPICCEECFAPLEPIGPYDRCKICGHRHKSDLYEEYDSEDDWASDPEMGAR